MFRFKLKAVAATFALAAGAAPALAQFDIVPSQPAAFDPINVRMTVDSCVFDASAVEVVKGPDAIQVRTRSNNCLVAGEPRVVDVRVGTYPPGDYRVDVMNLSGDVVNMVAQLRFTVASRPEIAVVPAPPRPLTDYTGMWWNPQESGWGLSLHQAPNHVVFATLFLYGANGQPEWYTLQPGGWTGSTNWNGAIYRTTGPYFGGPNYDPRLVLVQPVGSATLDFTQRPGQVGRASFSYTINGVTTTRTITRF